MSKIGSLAVNIVANTSKFNAGIKSVYNSIGGLTSKLSLIGDAVEGAIGGMLAKFASTGNELMQMSKATNISVEQLSFLKYAAQETGVGLETFTVAARTLIKQGIDPSRFEEFANKIAAIQDPLQRAQAAFYYFGKRSALALLPMVRDLGALKKRFTELGGSFTTEMAKHAEALYRSWGDVKFALSNAMYVIADALSPAIIWLTTKIADNGKAIKDWLSAHKQLVIYVAAGVTAFVVLAPILLTLAAAVTVVSSAVGLLTGAFALISAAPVILPLIAIVATVASLVYVLERAFGAWTKFKDAIGGLPSVAAQIAGLPPIELLAGPQGNYMGGGAVGAGPTGGGSSPIADSNADASNSRMDQMISLLAQIAGLPPIELSQAGVR